MAIKEPLLDLNIETEKSGFYQCFSKFVTVGSKISIGALILWAVTQPETAGEVLKAVRSSIDNNTGPWYMYVMAFYILVCFGLAIWPATGKIRLGGDGSRPEFSSFSWFSMMFGAGIGIGMLSYATGEPIYHFSNNPDVIMGNTTASSADNVRAAMKWSFLHWGFSAWGCYAIVGLALAFFSYSRGLPLTIRSGLTPLFGRALEGPLGHIVDIVSVIATILGVSLTLGMGCPSLPVGCIISPV
jgi:choline-glycine betaine transporter